MSLSAVHLHLMLNHIPVLGTIFVLAVLAWGLFRRSREVTTLALGLAVLLAIATVPAYLTGEPAEHLVEHESWFPKDLAHDHEESGETTFIAVIATGVVALGALALRRGDRHRLAWLPTLVALGLLVSFALAARTALLGGQIRHQEVRPGAVLAPPAPDTD